MLTVDDVAERWQCSRKLVRTMIRSGRLEAVRIGREYRIRPEAVEAFERGDKNGII
jgi:excisionase family DNA binding protein